MRRLPAIAVLVLLAAACSSGDAFDKIPDPGAVSTIPVITTSTEPDLSGVPLNPVPGSTSTTVSLGPGPMTIVGVVEGPEGVVPGAIVELERLVGDASATTRVPTAPDGTWNLEKVLGGRYRIRAWRSPDLAMSKPQVVFIESGPQRSVKLQLAPVGGIRVDAVVAPDPPIVDRDANLKVRVLERTVDAEGIVRDAPRSDEAVKLGGTGEWELDSPNPSITGIDGTVIFRVTCRDGGQQPLFAELDDGEAYALLLPSCVTPVSSTTTTSTDDETTTTTRSSTTSSSSTTSTTTTP